jgi:peroxiredoxin Q/BCP
MSQLRDEYARFTVRHGEILVVGPESPKRFQAYWRRHQLPFVGLPDPEHRVLKLYGQEVKLFKLGRMPAQVIVDLGGRVRYVYYGNSMTDIPANAEIIVILDQLNLQETP